MACNTYTGRVLDGETKAFVDGAKITLELCGESYIIHSDSEGFYKFVADLKQENVSARIRVETEGYEQYNRNIISNKNEEIHLTPKKKKLKNYLNEIAAFATVISTIIAIVAYINDSSAKLPDSQPNPSVSSKQDCDPAYPDLCIAKDSSNLKCSNVKKHNFKVLSPDPHNFDRDGDGIGCEK